VLCRQASAFQVAVVELELAQPFVARSSFTFDDQNQEDVGAINRTLENASSQSVPNGPYIYSAAEDYSESASMVNDELAHSAHLGSPRLVLSKSKQNIIQRAADAFLDLVYPNATSLATHVHVEIPNVLEGGYISCTHEKFSAKLSAVTEIKVFYI
jgi:hypothetical protein